MKTKTNLKAGAYVDYFRRPKPNHNQTIVRDGIKVATNLKAGLFDVFRRPKPRPNHSQTFVRDGVRRRVKVATGIKAGIKLERGGVRNHSQTLVRDGVPQRVKVSTGIKAGRTMKTSPFGR